MSDVDLEGSATDADKDGRVSELELVLDLELELDR